ncbi:MAG: hypothetical protein ACK5KT_06365 [Dysgonomonas sp.]
MILKLRSKIKANADYRAREVLKNYRPSTFVEIREMFKEQERTEEEFRNSLYNGDERQKPDKDIERFVQRIFHPSEEDLSDELLSGI